MPPKTRPISEFKKKLEESKDEEMIQREIINLLESHFFIVLQTTHRAKRPRCFSCGNNVISCDRCHDEIKPQGAYGATKGVPDILVTHKCWPEYMFCAIEVKEPKGEMNQAQQQLFNIGRIPIARSDSEALDIVTEFERLNNLREL